MTSPEGSDHQPSLVRHERDGIAWWTDDRLAECGIRVAFTERGGGISSAPYHSLNLAAHVGDDLADVDENRDRCLRALGLAPLRDRLTMAEQVHGDGVVVVGGACASPGAGAFASPDRAERTPPVPGADALVTRESGTPLMLCFADCVPVVLVAEADGALAGPAVAVAHAGWAGALAGIPGSAARRLAAVSGCEPARIRAYIGAHIAACHYEVGYEILSQFVNTFGTVARAESGGLDLGAVVSASLTDAGVDPWSIASLGTCTAEATDRFFSYRAEGGLTGRHGALACILSS